MMLLQRISLLLFSAVLLSGCALWPFGESEEERQRAEIVEDIAELNRKVPELAPSTFRAVGYGTMAMQNSAITSGQRKILAMRASQVDAYRSLAERVYGTNLSGNTTIQNLAVTNDQLKAFIDTTIMGARVIAQTEIEPGIYETVVEMVVHEGFRNCLRTHMNDRTNVGCNYESLYGVVNDHSRQEGPAIGLNNDGMYFID
ncbi:LPP20 family lipoprotein [Salinibius halmophilus]|uniref:LPP20 family lipoprotein n=1 Tax=Salinibius halmophilus TaxID=1853216 RepID=UPI000E660131|nr:LPP20 family lipoprotein [Salinibius halmophilus]